MNKKIA